MTGYKSSCILVPELRHNDPCLHKNKIRFDIKSAFSKLRYCFVHKASMNGEGSLFHSFLGPVSTRMISCRKCSSLVQILVPL